MFSKATRSAGDAASTAGDVGKGAVKNVVLPVVTAVAGTAAGVVLSRKGAFKKQRKVLGIPLPSPDGNSIEALAKNVGEAGKQFGKLAGEVKEARQRAEQVGKALR